MPAFLQGLAWNQQLAAWNQEVVNATTGEYGWLLGDALDGLDLAWPGVVLLVFEWSFSTTIYVGLVVLFGRVRLLIVSWRVFGWRFWLAFVIWLGLVGCVLFWGGFFGDD